jgi:hypothetical protein
MSLNFKNQLFFSSGGSELPPENDRPPVILLTVFIVVLFGGLALVAIASKQLLWTAAESSYDTRAGAGNPSLELQEMRAKEDSVLTSYDLVDQEKGFYRIPIQQAMDAFVTSQNK